MGRVVRPHQHFEILLRVNLRTGLQQRDIQAAFRKDFGRHAAARAGTNHANIVSFRRTRNLSHANLPINLFYEPSSSLRTFFNTHAARSTPTEPGKIGSSFSMLKMPSYPMSM